MELDMDNNSSEKWAFDFEGGFKQRESVPTPMTPPNPMTPPPEYVREIDLQDGSGVQRFVGSTPEELIDKLTEAQRNATMKIRELSQAAPMLPPELPPTPEPLTAEEQFLIGQQFVNDPVGAFDALFERRTGMTYEDFQKQRDYVDTIQGTVAVSSAVDQFLSVHEGKDYFPTENNRQAILGFLERTGRTPDDIANLEFAFSQLNVSGLLERPVDNTRSLPTTISDRSNMAPGTAPGAGEDVARFLKTAPLDEVKKYLNTVGRQLNR